VGNEIHIGAMTTENQLIWSALLQEKVPLLVEGARAIADPQVRYRGTIGGDISHGDPGNDHPALMLALDASFVLRGPKGERVVQAADFFFGLYATALEPGEVLTRIQVPTPGPGTGWAYEKLKRKIGDFATAAAAVLLRLQAGKVAGVSIALTQRRCDPAEGHGRRGVPGGPGARRGQPRRGRALGDGDLRPGRRPARRRRLQARHGRRDDPPRPAEGAIPRHRLTPHSRETSMAQKTLVSFTLNGKEVDVAVEPRELLIHTLRERLLHTGAHIGCETSHCGACTVDLDGMSVKSCTLLTVQCQGASLLTIEGLEQNGTLHALQQAFHEQHGCSAATAHPG
jgi:xanthine dehydrogenase iron-sulfur cluster and FAD-binding subunit A